MSDLPAGKADPKNDVKRLGIFGGTFDPVHLGHLICADQLREALGLDLVLFVPASAPPHKPEAEPAPAEHRLAMVRMAVEDHAGFQVSDIEIRRGGVSYTIDTVTQLRKSFGERTEFWLLMGQDSFAEVSAWKEPARIAAECFFGVACRPGYPRGVRSPVPQARAEFVDITAVDISSTDIRARLRWGKGIRYLVPLKVEAYIRQVGVYI
jgi:nicotinate-nucleotide adenylyltransferase